MRSNDEDEALHWVGERDPSHYESPEPKRPAANRPAPASAVTSEDTVDELRPATSAPVLISLGILGGIYLLYTVGWFVSWQRLGYADPDPLGLTAFRIQQVLAILAPAAWFGLAIYLTRDRKPAPRLVWLVIGALALVPWSFTFGR